MDPSFQEMIEQLNRLKGVYTEEDFNRRIQPLIQALEGNDYRQIQGLLTSNGFKINPEFEKYLDNMISQQNTQEARSFETGQRDTSLISAGEQLEQLGLSASGVLQTGGLNTNAVGAADNSKNNISLARYQQNMAIAKSMIGMVQSLASAGIYGASLGHARKAASVVSDAASNSAYDVMETGRISKKERQNIMSYLMSDKVG